MQYVKETYNPVQIVKITYNMESKGLGDTIAKITETSGIAAAVEAITKAAGIQDCGCKKRQEQLNQIFPYKKEE